MKTPNTSPATLETRVVAWVGDNSQWPGNIARRAGSGAIVGRLRRDGRVGMLLACFSDERMRWACGEQALAGQRETGHEFSMDAKQGDADSVAGERMCVLRAGWAADGVLRADGR